MLVRNILSIRMILHRSHRLALSVFIVIVGIVLTVSVSQATTVSATMSTQERASQMIALATSAMTKANQTLLYAYQTDVDSTVIEVAEALFSEGKTQVTLALATFRRESPAPPSSWGNVSLVNALVLDALHSFHLTVDMIAQQWDEASIIPDWRSLQDTITRYEQYLEQITATLQITQTVHPDYDYVQLMNYVSVAERHLTQAAANLTRLSVNQTTQNLNSARALLEEINRELTQITASTTIKGSQVLHFINESRHTLATYQASALSLGLNIEQLAATITANLDFAQQLTETDAVDDTMPLLREAYQLLRDIADEIAREKGINE